MTDNTTPEIERHIDPLDTANDLADRERQSALTRIKADIPKGVSGHCDECGNHSPRLVGGVCARCRDGR